MSSISTGKKPGNSGSGNQVPNTQSRPGKHTDGMQFVEFILGQEYYAVNLFQTREVITPSEIRPLPNTPDYIRGVMDLRGSITTIIDLKKLMNLDEGPEKKKRSRIIILDKEETQKSVGVLVDDVYSVSTHQPADIESNTEGSTQNSKHILGVIRKTVKTGETESQKLILWLDIQAIRDSVEKDL